MNDPELLRRLGAYRRADNVTNWFYIARAYVYLALVIGLAVTWYAHRRANDFHWAWDVPVTLAAIILVGVGQHHLAVLGHDGSHHTLFRGRLLNELASDWLCFFPLFGTTQNYRLVHIPHHQHPNDPENDPDWVFLRLSGHGHRFRHPMPRGEFWWRCVIQPMLWVPGQVAYILVRSYAVVLGGSYTRESRPCFRLLALEFAFQGAVIALLALGVPGGAWRWLAPLGLLGLYVLASRFIPESWYPVPRIKPTMPQRWTRVMRLSYFTLLFVALAWLSEVTGWYCFLLWFVLWVVPMGTSFSFLMILRDEIQHSNAGQGRYRHTRVYEGNWLVRLAVFPMGMDYHLPHHLFPAVPHYHLDKVHALMSQDESYREEAVTVS
jgi:fatty acid desaturase